MPNDEHDSWMKEHFSRIAWDAYEEEIPLVSMWMEYQENLMIYGGIAGVR